MVVDFIFYVEGIEKNREICIILIQKWSGGVDEIRRAFRTQAKNYNGALCFKKKESRWLFSEAVDISLTCDKTIKLQLVVIFASPFA